MDNLSLDLIERFRDKYFPPYPAHRRILDVGSMDVNGSCRDIFPAPNWGYTGLDIRRGPNVDLIPKDPYGWTELQSESFDCVISCCTLEHIEYPWLTVCEIKRVMRPGAMCLIIVPSKGTRHRHPIDCYRFQQRGVEALAKWAGITSRENIVHDDGWGTIAFVGVK
jgi:SAM-dependent methyltransferase